jgi:hypothetical protein
MKGLLFYGGMIAAAVLLFLVVRSAGAGLSAPPGPAVAVPISSAPAIDTLFHALMSLAVIVVVARAVGGLFSLIGQPAVVGEVVGGIMPPTVVH